MRKREKEGRPEEEGGKGHDMGAGTADRQAREAGGPLDGRGRGLPCRVHSTPAPVTT